MNRWQQLLRDRKSQVQVVGIVNVSPESFYKRSVEIGENAIALRVREMEAQGARALDLGARSTAPYKDTDIPIEEEERRLRLAIRAARVATDLPLLSDTMFAIPAQAALEEGADAINDVSALKNDGAMAPLIAASGCGLVLMANEMVNADSEGVSPPEFVQRILSSGVERALRAGIPEDRLMLDPGIGFFRNQGIPWYQWDLEVLRALPTMMGHFRLPFLVGVSRKSFLGEVLGRPWPDDRLAGSLSVHLWLARQGVELIRCHDVPETIDALRMQELLDH